MRKIAFIAFQIFLIVAFVTVNTFAAESDVDKLLNLLVDKGVLTVEDAAGFRADLAISKQDEVAAQKEFQVSAAKQLKISGYTQARYQVINGKGNIDSIDIRRARIDIRGALTSRYDYRTQIEFGGTKGPFLLDATVVAKFSPALNITLGQTGVPISLENVSSTQKLETINLSQAVEALASRGKDVIGNNNGKDIGITAGGKLVPVGDAFLFDYTIGVFNGNGINAADKNDQKDIAGRLVYHPSSRFDIGGSYYNGKGNWAAPTAANRNRDRFGFDFDYHFAPVTFKGEYISGKDDKTRKDGWYLQLGRFLVPGKLQGVLKYDTYDADRSKTNNETDVYTFGLNRYFNKWAFIQVNYELKREKGKELDNDALTTQFTYQF